MTTNNHPANGPVSLDRLHQISEILSKASAQSDGGNLGYAMADAVKVIDGAIAAFGAEPVAWIAKKKTTGEMELDEPHAKATNPKYWTDAFPVYTTPPAPVVPDMAAVGEMPFLGTQEKAFVSGWNSCRAAMLQAGNSPVVQLPTEFYSENGVVVQLEKVIAALALNGIEYKRNLQAPRVSLRDAISAIKSSGIEVDAREIQEELDILNSPVAPDGWVMLPVDPTEKMIIAGFESEPDEFFSEEKEWETYEAMSGCQQAAHRAKLCYAAMLAAAPQQEVK
ncbi:hypothetical protein DB992_12495 [Salmonella enterica]|nr:hypothetical protein [Salmonella enterica]EBN4821856.1 hypothetical protein [Salmonella enterica]